MLLHIRIARCVWKNFRRKNCPSNFPLATEQLQLYYHISTILKIFYRRLWLLDEKIQNGRHKKLQFRRKKLSIQSFACNWIIPALQSQMNHLKNNLRTSLAARGKNQNGRHKKLQLKKFRRKKLSIQISACNWIITALQSQISHLKSNLPTSLAVRRKIQNGRQKNNKIKKSLPKRLSIPIFASNCPIIVLFSQISHYENISLVFGH